MTNLFRSRTDDELVAACNRDAGEEAAKAFSELYRRYRDYVLRIALRFTDDREVAADALQEVFAYLLKQFPPPGTGLELRARLTTYLYPIAKNTTLTLLRKARRDRAPGVEPDELTAPEDPAAGEDDLDRLLRGLSPERREILGLRFIDGMSLDEIAEALGIPTGTVKSRLHHAIRELRDSQAAKEFFES
ncbi:MAG TPA: sigma-70 family RNA polymerase sigma factor [Gammaproteobacteria bacterium]|nr:sigma-70 family RNA polymerase sigma factor [Gammaproteobacteria bacterium]